MNNYQNNITTTFHSNQADTCETFEFTDTGDGATMVKYINNTDPDYGYSIDSKSFACTPNTPIFNNISNNTHSPDYVITDGVTTKGAILKVDGTIEVQGRDILKELDEMRDAMLLLNRDVSMEQKYPELKEAYDNYKKILDELTVIEKLTNECT